jgi:CubicO group peptidase (beta-lactamase class C family)
MKRSIPSVFFILFFYLFSNALSGQQGPYSKYLDHPWVDSVLSTLSSEEKIAQSLWLVASPDDRFVEIMESARNFGEHGPGGLIFTACPDEQMQEMADFFQSFSRIPLAIAQDGIMDGQYPDINTLGAIASDSLRYMAGLKLAAEIRREGVDLIISEGMDDALAAGLSDNLVHVIDPKAIQRVRIGEPGNFFDVQDQADTIDYRARQVLALKYCISQQEAEKGEGRQEMMPADWPNQSAFVRDLYEQSITVLKNQGQVIPLKELESTRIACLAVNQKNMTAFQNMAGKYTRTENYFWFPGRDDNEELIEQLAGYDLVLAGIYPGQSPEEMKAFLSLLKKQTQLIVVWFGDPASLEQCSSIVSKGTGQEPGGLILAYEQKPIIEGLSAQVIFGAVSGRGRLPEALGDQYPAGSGIITKGGLRLQYGFPENAGVNSKRLHHSIDSIVKGGLEAGAYPGCQVIIARKGTVIFQKAYGYHTYEKRIEVRNNDLYDLASVTKISGPLSGLMLLEGMGKFSYQKQLGDYCSAMKGSDKEDLALKDILAHRAGLYPWIPYYEDIIKKNGQYKKRFLRTDAARKHNLQVADRVYLKDTYKTKIFKEIRKSELGEQKYLYSGLSFFLFPTIIEELSGQPYETFLSENIYHRLGAWELLYHPRNSFPASRIVPTEIDSVFRKQLMHGYVHDEGAAMMGAYAGNAGLFASANDLLKLIEMYRRMGSYGGEQIIHADVLKEYSSYQFPELEIRRGLGFDKPLLNENNGTPRDYPCPGAPASSFGHSGFTGTFVWADPENEISYVFLSNRVHTTRTNQLLYEMNIRTNILQSVYDSIIDP